MLTITTDPDGHRVFISAPGTGTRGFGVTARDKSELHECIDHYYVDHNATQHTNKQRKACPLCRKD